MAIRKDVNDMLNNLKQEEPPKEEKHVKSKFDNMSVDDLMNALNDGKEPPRKAPIRELKRIPSSKKNDYSKPENNNPPKKKKIVIGELPDYDAIEQQEIEKEIKKKNPIAENKKKDTVKENKDSEKKGFFARVKDLMYASADDEEETEEEKETSDDDDTNGNFTVEEIKESSEIAIASIEEAISAINDNELVKDEEKTVSENEDKPKENKSEPVSKNNNKKKNNNKSKQNNSQKTKNSNSESETKPEKSEERKSETETEKPEEKKSESQIEKEEEKPETKTENTVDSEEKKEPPKNTSQSGSGNKKKKNRNKQKKDNQKPVKSSDSIIEDIQKDAEKAISEIENSDSSKNEKQEDSDVAVVEEIKNGLQDSVEQEENNSEEPTENTDDDEIIVRISETPVKSSEKYKKSRYAIPALLCIVLAIIGVIAIVSTLISNIGGKDDFEKAVYPAVIMNIESFDSPSELTSDQIISATIWSVVIDDEKLSKYNEIMGAVNIPASDVEEYAVELFGEDIPELNHTTVGAAESRFYYNKDAQSYNVPIKPDTFTYIPEVTSVSKKSGEYVVNVNYIEEHPEWMEKSVAKEVQFRLSKNDNGGYKIDSMEVFSESSST